MLSLTFNLTVEMSVSEGEKLHQKVNNFICHGLNFRVAIMRDFSFGELYLKHAQSSAVYDVVLTLSLNDEAQILE